MYSLPCLSSSGSLLLAHVSHTPVSEICLARGSSEYVIMNVNGSAAVGEHQVRGLPQCGIPIRLMSAWGHLRPIPLIRPTHGGPQYFR